MTTFNTGNPIGSIDPRDLSDNSENFDNLSNGTALAYNDRLGVSRKSWAGIEAEVAEFFIASGYEFVGDYAGGITITGYNQVVRDAGEFWRVSGSTALPYNTTGAGLPEGGAFVAVGDAALRQELATATAGQGSDQVAHVGTTDTVTEALNKRVIYVGSVAELESLDSSVGTAVYLTQDGRAGEFVVKAGTPPSDPQKGIYIVLANGDYAERQFSGPVNVKWFGANGDDVTVDTLALQAAHSTLHNVFYPSGTYRIDATIQVVPGSKAYGVKGPRFDNTSLTSIIRHTVADSPVFAQNVSTATGQEDGFSAYDLSIKSDQGIRLNDLEDLVDDGVAGTNPYIMRSEFRRLTLQPLTAGNGVGISMSKCFDFIIEQCEILNYGTHIILQGCDLGKVVTNRFTNIYDHGVLELSCSTFGSQTEIAHNDMVQIAKTTGRFIRSTARHVRIYNNYMEQQSGDFVGFIDLSKNNPPQFGLNVPSPTAYSSIDVDSNRLDGQAFATGFIYRLSTDRLLSTRIIDSKTTGVTATMPWLLDDGGNDILLPIAWNFNNLARYELSGGRGTGAEQSKFKNFKSKDLPVLGGVSFDAESIIHLSRESLTEGNAFEHIRLMDCGFRMLASLGTNLFRCILPKRYGIANPYLKSGVNYNIIIRARTTSGTETLRALYVVDGAGTGSTVNTVLTNQTSKISIGIAGAASTSEVGVALFFNITSPSTDILIESVSFEEA